MSVYVMSLIFKSGLPKAEKAIALAYADHAHDDGTHIYPSVGYTAWKTGYSERSVQRITKDLVSCGVLTVCGVGKRGTNRYEMIFSALPERLPYGGDKLSPPRQPRQSGVTTTTHRGDTMTPETLDNHNKNHKEHYLLFLSIWEKYLPHKPQPRLKNKSLQSKLDTRLKCDHFSENWIKAIGTVSTSVFVKKSTWFDANWFLKNDTNWEKCLNGNYGGANNDAPKPTSKQQMIDLIGETLQKYGRRDFKAVRKSFTDDQWEIVKRIGSWNGYITTLSTKALKFAVYEAMA